MHIATKAVSAFFELETSGSLSLSKSENLSPIKIHPTVFFGQLPWCISMSVRPATSNTSMHSPNFGEFLMRHLYRPTGMQDKNFRLSRHGNSRVAKPNPSAIKTPSVLSFRCRTLISCMSILSFISFVQVPLFFRGVGHRCG